MRLNRQTRRQMNTSQIVYLKVDSPSRLSDEEVQEPSAAQLVYAKSSPSTAFLCSPRPSPSSLSNCLKLAVVYTNPCCSVYRGKRDTGEGTIDRERKCAGQVSLGAPAGDWVGRLGLADGTEPTRTHSTSLTHRMTDASLLSGPIKVEFVCIFNPLFVFDLGTWICLGSCLSFAPMLTKPVRMFPNLLPRHRF